MATIFSASGNTPSESEFREFLSEQQAAGRIVRLTEVGEPYYSLTLSGNHYLPADLRKKRDKFRVYLLRDAHRARYIESRDVDEELAGVSPASDTSSRIKGRAPNKLVLPAFGRRVAPGRAYWPRIQGQFDGNRTGLTRLSRDTFPSFVSFSSQEQAGTAISKNFVFDYVGLSACLGISAQLIWNISRDTSRYYRRFEIAKKAGGVRVIESPRLFLKVIQWFLMDFVLAGLKKEDSVHSFSFQRSIATNAQKHEGQAFVGSVDIKDFFGSITDDMVKRHLDRNGFSQFESVVISKLCTNRGALPQGAPTSPIISNSILFDFDSAMSLYCELEGLKYTRYADDITISGGARNDVAAALQTVGSLLDTYGLKLNSEKTRIASNAGQQRVTGVVVNSSAAPPRIYRRKARAMFHAASIAPVENIERIPELGGIIGYLKIFPKLSSSREVQNYEVILRDLKVIRRGRMV